MEREISIETLANTARQVVRIPISLVGPQTFREHLIRAFAGSQLSRWNLSANGTGFSQSLHIGDVVQLPGYNLTFLSLGQAAPVPPSLWRFITRTDQAAATLLAAAITVAVLFGKL